MRRPVYRVGETSGSRAGTYISITERDYADALKARDVLVCLSSLELKFLVVIILYEDFERRLFEIILAATLHRGLSRSKASDIYIKVNQPVMALLTATRTYHDTQIPKDLGKISTLTDPYTENANAIFNRIFDASFDYRLMEGIRNYAQHHQLPISRFTLGSSRTEGGAGLSASKDTIDPVFDCKRILESDKVRRKTRDEISSLKIDWVDVKFAVRAYVEGIVAGHNAVRSMLMGDVEKASETYEKFQSRYREEVGAAELGEICILLRSGGEFHREVQHWSHAGFPIPRRDGAGHQGPEPQAEP